MLYIVQMVAVLYITSLDSLAYCFGFSVRSNPPPQPHLHPHLHFFLFRYGFFVKIHLLESYKIRVVGFALKKLFTHFEMLIVSHALGKWSFISLTVCYTVLVPVLDNHVSDELLMSTRNLKE